MGLRKHMQRDTWFRKTSVCSEVVLLSLKHHNSRVLQYDDELLREVTVYSYLRAANTGVLSSSMHAHLVVLVLVASEKCGCPVSMLSWASRVIVHFALMNAPPLKIQTFKNLNMCEVKVLGFPPPFHLPSSSCCIIMLSPSFPFCPCLCLPLPPQ